MNKRIAVAAVMFGMVAFQAEAGTVLARGKLPATGTPSAQDNPPCEEASKEFSQNLAQRLQSKGSEIIGKSTAALGLGSDPFNERRLNKSACLDLCVTIPTGAEFKAEGSVTPIDWRGKLSSELPQTSNPGNWAAVSGPFVAPSSKADVVCYTFKNWSHDQERYVGLKVTY